MGVIGTEGRFNILPSRMSVSAKGIRRKPLEMFDLLVPVEAQRSSAAASLTSHPNKGNKMTSPPTLLAWKTTMPSSTTPRERE